MKKTILFILSLIYLTGCSANLLNEKINFDQPMYKEPSNNKVAVISRIRLDLNGSHVIHRYKNSLQEAISDAIYSTGMYQEVIYGNKTIDAKNLQTDHYKIEVIAKDFGKYNWLFTWPAVYPMTLYWPIQPYSGIVAVQFKIDFQRNDYQTSHTIRNEKHHGVVIYGFFRKGEVENKVIPLYYSGLDQLRDFVLKVNLESPQSNRPIIAERPEKRSQSPMPWDGKVNNIAILPLSANAISASEVKALSNRLSIELFNTGRFSILERSQMKAILDEQGFQQSGCTSTECAVEAGQLLNVEQMITGSVSRVGQIYSVEVRLINVETGKIDAVGVTDIRGGIEEVLINGMNRVVMNMLQ